MVGLRQRRSVRLNEFSMHQIKICCCDMIFRESNILDVGDVNDDSDFFVVVNLSFLAAAAAAAAPS